MSLELMGSRLHGGHAGGRDRHRLNGNKNVDPGRALGAALKPQNVRSAFLLAPGRLLALFLVVVHYYSDKLWGKLGFMAWRLGASQSNASTSSIPACRLLMDRHGRNLVAAAREVLKESQDERERERAQAVGMDQ